MEELLKNDKFIQYIISTHLPSSEMTYQEKIQSVFSSTKEFTTAMHCYKLAADTVLHKTDNKPLNLNCSSKKN